MSDVDGCEIQYVFAKIRGLYYIVNSKESTNTIAWKSYRYTHTKVNSIIVSQCLEVLFEN